MEKYIHLRTPFLSATERERDRERERERERQRETDRERVMFNNAMQTDSLDKRLSRRE